MYPWSALAAFLLCARASEVCDPADNTDQCAEQRDTKLSLNLLQAGARLQGSERPDSLPNKGPGYDDLPTFVVDLDVAPELRWRQVTRHFTDLGVFPKLLQSYNVTDPARLSLARTLEVEEEYVRELRGIIADVGLPESYVDVMILAQSRYELSGDADGPRGNLDEHSGNWRECSGLLAAMPNGTVIHGRNMDYGGFQIEAHGRILQYPDVSIEVVFMRDGRPLFTSVHWPGEIGVNTGMRFGGWSLERNTRDHFLDSSILYGLFRGSQISSLCVRKLMETEQDFETVVQKLGNLNLMAPLYFVVAGHGAYEGAVITMDRGGSHMPNTPLVTRLSSSKTMLNRNGQLFTDWNIIQTNDDLDKAALDSRRPEEELKLAASTQDMVSVDWVLGQMTAAPLYTYGTVYTAVYVPATSYHKTVAHYGYHR